LEPGVPDYTFGLHSVPYYPNPLADKALALAGEPSFPYFKLPAYLLTNILISYRVPVHFNSVKSIKLSLNVQNLFGIQYYQHQYLFGDEFSNKNGTFLNTPDSAYAYVGPPRSVFFNASITF
jgi:outer membrane receptor protein involved in Fe transport